MPVRFATLANTCVITPDTTVNRESSCDLGHYYDAKNGDLHAQITEYLMNNREDMGKYQRLTEALKNIKSINKQFIKDFQSSDSDHSY